METFEKLIYQEFVRYGYREILTIKEMKLFGSEESIDYWLVCPFLISLTEQKKLFDLINRYEHEMEFFEKNISLLFLVNEDVYKSCDRISIENNKAYFKKYVLSYTCDAARQLYDLMIQRQKNSIAELLMDEQLFEALKESPSRSITLSSLLYSIAHKLPFIPILLDVENHFSHYTISEPELLNELAWVNDSPDNDVDLDKYVETILNEKKQ